VTASQMRDLRGQQAERQWQGRQLQNGSCRMAAAEWQSQRSAVAEAMSSPKHSRSRSSRSNHRSEVAAAHS
jgi:hypothetical protein